MSLVSMVSLVSSDAIPPARYVMRNGLGISQAHKPAAAPFTHVWKSNKDMPSLVMQATYAARHRVAHGYGPAHGVPASVPGQK